MKKTNNVKIFACGKIPSTIVERFAAITDNFEDYLKINNCNYSRYGIKSLLEPLEEDKSFVQTISLYKKHEKTNSERIGQVLEGLDAAIILADLRDENSFNDIERISRIAKEKDILVIAMVLIPYSTDENRQLKYDKEIKYLTGKVDTFIPLLAEKIAFDSNKPLIDEDGINFSESYMEFWVEELMQFFQEGLVNIEKETISEIFKNSGLGFVLVAMGKGKDAVERELKHRVLNKRKMIKCNKLLVGISGNKDMDLPYIRSILGKIQAGVREDCNIVFAAFVDDKLENDLIITAIGIESI